MTTYRSAKFCTWDARDPKRMFQNIRDAFNEVMQAAFGYIPDTTGFGATERRSTKDLSKYLSEATRDLNLVMVRNNPKLPKFEVYWETGPYGTGNFAVRVEQPEEISA